MSKERAEELIKKYLAGNATPEEEALLESWYIEMANAQPEIPGTPDYPRIEAEILAPLRAEHGAAAPVVKPPVRLWPRIAAAAAVIIIVSIGSIYVFRKPPPPPIAEAPPTYNAILPAGTKATLTLLDGHAILLDSAGGDNLARQANAVVSAHNGQLAYRTSDPAPLANNASNTLTTRPGEHYSVILPDGTKAWLNAASSLTYPVTFTGNQREVTVTGEVYFEIVHNAKQPFRVAVKDQLVEDIGTHLDIKAYDDEPGITTSLLEGSVKLTRGNAAVTLKPGQQATIQPGAATFELASVEPDQPLSWKNGYFYFDHADIKTVMRELARWYNIKVTYKGEIPKRTFKGKVYRNIKAEEALSILSYFGAHFHIDGRTVTVIP